MLDFTGHTGTYETGITGAYPAGSTFSWWGDYLLTGDSSLVRLDVTEMVAIWADDATANRGFVLAPSAGEEGSVLPEFAGGLRAGVATLTIWYTPRATEVEHDDGDR